MRRRIGVAAVLLGVLGAWVSGLSQTAAAGQLQQMLDASQRRGTLEIEGGEPFHLVASFEYAPVGSKEGATHEKGSLDELWENPRRYRRTITLPGETLVEVDSGTQAWRTGKWSIDQYVGLAIEAAVQPFYERPATNNRLSAEVRKENPTLSCVGTEPEIAGVTAETRLALTTFCMAPGNHLIRMILRPNSLGVAFNDIQPFGKKFVARTIEVSRGSQVVLQLHVDALTSAGDLSGLDSPAAEGAQILSFHRADLPYRSGELKLGQVMKTAGLMSPVNGFRGVVVVKVHVNTEGKVDQAEVIGSANQIIKNAALACVRQWEYRVSYQGDKIMPQETVVAINFGSY